MIRRWRGDASEVGEHDIVMIRCDGCGEAPLLYTQHKCDPTMGCDDFDLCDMCFCSDAGRWHPPQHAFISCARPRRRPIALLGDCVAETILNALDNYERFPCLGCRPETSEFFRWTTFGQVRSRSLAIAAALREKPGLGLPVGAAVVLIGPNSVEWAVAALAIVFAGLVLVPFHESTSADDAVYAAELCECSLVLALSPQHVRDAVGWAARARCVRVVVFAGPEQQSAEVQIRWGAADAVLEQGPQVHLLVDLLAKRRALCGDECAVEAASHRLGVHHAQRGQLRAIVFTSGSTGRPKGAAFTDEALNRDLRFSCFQFEAKPAVTTALLPFAWLTGLEDLFAALLHGTAAAIVSAPWRSWLSDCRRVRPSRVKVVPSLLAMLSDELEARVASHIGALKHRVTEEDRSKIRKRLMVHLAGEFPLGNRLSILITGGAKTSQALLETVRALLPHVQIIDAYGATEVGGVLNDSQLLSGVEAKLESVPELGYLTSDTPPRGQLWVRTVGLIDGYFRDPEATSERFRDGWFATGDIVARSANGSFTVIDRLKHVIKLQSGEFVAPLAVEARIERSHWVRQAFVYGEMEWTALAAVLVLNEQVVRAWLAGAHRELLAAQSSSLADLLSQRDVFESLHAVVVEDVHAVVRGSSERSLFVPRFFLLETEPFTAHNGLLTPTLKINRLALTRRYAESLRALVAAEATERQRDGLPIAARQFSAESLAAAVREVVEQSMGRSRRFPEHVPLVELGLDSMGAVALQAAVQRRFGVRPTLEQILRGAGSIASLVEYVRSACAPRAVSAERSGEGTSSSCWWRIELLPLHGELVREFARCRVDSSSASLRSAVPHERLVLVTGGAGFVGAFLIAELLSRALEPRKSILALVRSHRAAPLGKISSEDCSEAGAHADAAAAARLKSRMEEFGLWRDEWHARLRVLAADLSKPFLGRGFAGYSELAALPVDTVFHCAAWVNWLLPVDALRPANVDGTARILLLCADFMRRGQSLRFVLVSTLSVLHRGPEAALETAPMAPEQAASDLRSGYAQSKWLAEALLHHAARAGEAQLFEARVVRLGMVTGHSQSGACDAAQFVPRFLLSCTRRQAVLRDPLVDNERFEMLPVDTAARMVALLGLAPRVGAQRPGDIAVYHVASPPELCPSYAELASWIRDAAPMLQWREEQLERWAATVLADKEDPLYPLAAFVASPHAFRTGTRISCANALRDLSALKQALFHPISSEIVAASVRFLLNREAESRASRSLLTSDMSEGTQHQGAAGLQVTVSPPSAEQALPRATHVVRLPWTRRADDERDDESKGSQSDDNDAEGRDGPLPSSQIGGPLPRTARRRPREEFFLETDAEGRLLPPVNNPDLPRRLSRDHSFMLPAETKDGQNDRLGATTERK